MRKVFSILLLTVLASAVAGPRLAAQRQTDDEDRHVVVINARSSPMMRLYGARTSTSDWEENILSQPIAPGARIRINFDDGTGACYFDFRAVFKDKQVVYRWNINVCVESEWRAVD
jgi:hypothetical protein